MAHKTGKGQQYSPSGDEYDREARAKAARGGAARKGLSKAKRDKLWCQSSSGQRDPNCKGKGKVVPKKTAGVEIEGGGALRKQIWSGAGRTGDLVSYAHGKQTGTEEQDAEKAGITRMILEHNAAQKKKRG